MGSPNKKTLILTVALAALAGALISGASKFLMPPAESRQIHIVENYAPPDPEYVFYTDEVETLLAEQESDAELAGGVKHARMGFLPMPDDIQQGFEKARPAWQKNAVHAEVLPNQPRIVIVIDDMGVNISNTRRVIDLPAPLTLSFLPYANGLKKLSRDARAKGHELMVHVPMEPMGDGYDAGPAPLLTSLDKAEIMKRLRNDLSSFDGYVGINNHMGSKFTRDSKGMTLVLGELKRRGLLFLDSRTISGTVGKEIAAMYDLPFAARDVFLDHEATTEFVEKALARSETIAEAAGVAIAIGHPKKVTIDALEKWIPEARKRGFAIVPITNVIQQTPENPAQVASSHSE